MSESDVFHVREITPTARAAMDRNGLPPEWVQEIARRKVSECRPELLFGGTGTFFFRILLKKTGDILRFVVSYEGVPPGEDYMTGITVTTQVDDDRSTLATLQAIYDNPVLRKVMLYSDEDLDEFNETIADLKILTED